jgi:hypothetical protein
MSSSLRVFLCHSSNDKASVRDLYWKLNQVSGIQPWLDEVDILPGQDWDEHIRRSIEAAHVVLVCLSKSSTTKEGYIQRELRYALDIAAEKPPDTIFLIPLLLEDCRVPRRLQDLQWLDLRESDAFGRLLTSLRFRGSQLEIQLPQFAGRIMYDSATEVDTRGWTVHSSIGDRSRARPSFTDTGLAWSLTAAGVESVGVNRSVRCLAGTAHFAYRATHTGNVLVCMIPVCAFWRGLLAATRFGCVAGPHLKCDGGTPDGRLGVISITPRRQIVSE